MKAAVAKKYGGPLEIIEVPSDKYIIIMILTVYDIYDYRKKFQDIMKRKSW